MTRSDKRHWWRSYSDSPRNYRIPSLSLLPPQTQSEIFAMKPGNVSNTSVPVDPLPPMMPSYMRPKAISGRISRSEFVPGRRRRRTPRHARHWGATIRPGCRRRRTSRRRQRRSSPTSAARRSYRNAHRNHRRTGRPQRARAVLQRRVPFGTAPAPPPSAARRSCRRVSPPVAVGQPPAHRHRHAHGYCTVS